jgi:hypothetical protein
MQVQLAWRENYIPSLQSFFLQQWSRHKVWVAVFQTQTILISSWACNINFKPLRLKEKITIYWKALQNQELLDVGWASHRYLRIKIRKSNHLNDLEKVTENQDVGWVIQIDPPRRPKKNDAEPMSYEDFRWKGAMGDEPSALIPTQPMRRKSIGKLVDDFQDVILTMNYCQISVASSHKDVGLSYRTPNIHAAFSA